MNERISTLNLFCRVARTGSFTAAGREIGLSQPSVSRVISKLEKELGAALFVRNTHAVNLTDVGADYLARVEPILSALEEANHMVRGNGKLQGRLRVGVATSFAVREVIPRLPDFLAEHPDLNVDLVLTDSVQDLVGEGIDVVIRFGPLTDSALVARKLGDTKRLIAASPAYLARAGTPNVPADLANHSFILGPSSHRTSAWNFKKNDTILSVRADSQLSVSVNEASTAAALAGIGIISTAYWGCRAELESGALIQLLPDWEIGTIEVHAILVGGRNIKPSAQIFTDFLVSAF